MKAELVLGLSAALLALSSCGGSDAPKDKVEKVSPLTAAHDKCAPEVETGMQAAYHEDAPAIDEMFVLDEEGQSLVVRTPDPGGELLAGSTFIAAACVLSELDAPATVLAAMQSTSALSGMQDADWDNVEASWTYAAGLGKGLTLALDMTD